MSYNVGSIDVIVSDNFRLPLEAIPELRKQIGHDHPESYLLESDEPGVPFALPPTFEDRDGCRYFRFLNWNGEGSGHTWDTFTDVVLPRFLGMVDIVVTWEDGDSHSGLRVHNGVVTRHKVVMSLGAEEK